MAVRPLFYVDFNELMEFDVVLLSQTDIKKDVSGNAFRLVEGLPIAWLLRSGAPRRYLPENHGPLTLNRLPNPSE
jgi:hypothetical protein